ncbi:hypothetical protein F5Y18DRAFT_369707 [Xylariaceae sp. FL1019]|nr:hypothetical protein F5Y18DRAFT_369707 [Xylariaceae sp. FL1019]
MSEQRFQISIVVFKSNPDYQNFRHTALHFVSEGGAKLMFHAVGVSRDYRLEARTGYDPASSQSSPMKSSWDGLLVRLAKGS